MTVAIVDYGMGNLHSVSKAVERLGYECVVTGDAEQILAADSVILKVSVHLAMRWGICGRMVWILSSNR